jgi:hypothetical protein
VRFRLQKQSKNKNRRGLKREDDDEKTTTQKHVSSLFSLLVFSLSKNQKANKKECFFGSALFFCVVLESCVGREGGTARAAAKKKTQRARQKKKRFGRQPNPRNPQPSATRCAQDGDVWGRGLAAKRWWWGKASFVRGREKLIFFCVCVSSGLESEKKEDSRPPRRAAREGKKKTGGKGK